MRASRSLIPPLSTTQPPWRLCKQNGDGVSKDEDGTSRNELCMVERRLDNFALLLSGITFVGKTLSPRAFSRWPGTLAT